MTTLSAASSSRSFSLVESDSSSVKSSEVDSEVDVGVEDSVDEVVPPPSMDSLLDTFPPQPDIRAPPRTATSKIFPLFFISLLVPFVHDY